MKLRSKLSHLWRNKKWIPLVLVVGLLTISFIYGWYFDASKPRSGLGWADQGLYAQTADRMASGHLPKPAQLHYAIGYPILGAIGHFISPGDPFMLVTYSLLIASAVLCYKAAESILGTRWALVFTGLLFLWDARARSFQYSSDLFAVPWNNQIVFFTFAYFFWLLTTKVKEKPPTKFLVASGLVAGLSFLSREEAVIFALPLLASWLYISKAHWRQWIIALSIMFLCFLPQLVIKKQVLGSFTKSGRKYSYSQLHGQYLQPKLFYRNVWETIIDSRHFNGPDPGRPALLQAAPWLVVAPVGFWFIFYDKKYPRGLKIWLLISVSYMVFYLAGSNMSAHKLKYHCLRYISAGFISLNLGVIVATKEGLYRTRKYFEKKA